MTKKITQIEEYSKKIMEGEIAHGFTHVDRVRNWAIKIANNEGFKDLELVETAALLHDIGLIKAETRSRHGEVGAEIAKEYLRENEFFNESEIEKIAYAIRHHNTVKKDTDPLLNIIRDADILDLLGAVGIMRAFTSKSSNPEYDTSNIKGETWGMSAREFDERFENGTGIGKTIIDQINFQISCLDTIYTKTAKEIANSLIEFQQRFLKQLEMEIMSAENFS